LLVSNLRSDGRVVAMSGIGISGTFRHVGFRRLWAQRTSVGDASVRFGFTRLGPPHLACPTGKSAIALSSPSSKNISLVPSGKSGALVRASFPTEGRWPTSSTREGMRWTQMR
jgi:hypothetical protein